MVTFLQFTNFYRLNVLLRHFKSAVFCSTLSIAILCSFPMIAMAGPLTAVSDKAIVKKNIDTIWISVLNNDKGVKNTSITLSIVNGPSSGEVHINKKNRIRYTPKKGFVGIDKFRYQIKNKKGAKSRAIVTVQVKGKGFSDPIEVSPSPIAEPDTATVKKDVDKIWISVLNNDKNLNNTPINVSIVGQPANGEVGVTSKNNIRYTPNSGFSGKDTFLYKVTDNKNQQSVATVTVNVIGSTSDPIEPPPPTNTISFLNLNWDPVSSEELGYVIYFGPTSGMLNKELSELPIDSDKWNREQPSVNFNIAKDLQLQSGDMACFAVQAYSKKTKSALSDPICRVIP